MHEMRFDNRHNVRLKYYGDTLAEIMICDVPIFSDGSNCEKAEAYPIPYDDKRGGQAEHEGEGEEEEKEGETNAERAQRRARKALFDIVACNPDLDLFVTFTLDKEKIDRYSYADVYKKLKNYLDNRVRRNGLKYVIVAEYHKDKAIHFHGLLNSEAVKLTPSIINSKGQQVYNVLDWSLGFSTAIYTYGDNRLSVVKYICKYISKGTEKVGGRYYYSGGDLLRPTYAYDDIVEEVDLMEWIKQKAGELGRNMGAPFEYVVDGLDRHFFISKVQYLQEGNKNGNTSVEQNAEN